MKIVGTGKSKDMPKGQVFDEPKDMAELLIEQGFATAKKEKTDPKEDAKPEGGEQVKPNANVDEKTDPKEGPKVITTSDVKAKA